MVDRCVRARGACGARARGAEDEPWGGLQVIFLADFCQGTPILEGDLNAERLANGGARPRRELAFEGEWVKTLEVVVLTEGWSLVERQRGETQLLAFLDDLRFGERTQRVLDTWSVLSGKHFPAEVDVMKITGKACRARGASRLRGLAPDGSVPGSP